MLCSVKRKNGRACSIPADRFVSNAWCCHVHDPNGMYQGRLLDHASDPAPARTAKLKRTKGQTEPWTQARRRAWTASKVEGCRNWDAATTGSGRPTPIAEAPLTAEEKYLRLHDPLA
jgi:hypothetical protein